MVDQSTVDLTGVSSGDDRAVLGIFLQVISSESFQPFEGGVLAKIETLGYGYREKKSK